MDYEICPICLVNIDHFDYKMACSNCTKEYCTHCILRWMDQSNKCPMCNIIPNEFIVKSDCIIIKNSYNIKKCILFNLLTTIQKYKL